MNIFELGLSVLKSKSIFCILMNHVVLLIYEKICAFINQSPIMTIHNRKRRNRPKQNQLKTRRIKDKELGNQTFTLLSVFSCFTNERCNPAQQNLNSRMLHFMYQNNTTLHNCSHTVVLTFSILNNITQGQWKWLTSKPEEHLTQQHIYFAMWWEDDFTIVW